MIRQPNNWNDVQEFSERPKLPLGAYVCRVNSVRVDTWNGDAAQLCVTFDISEGEYAGYFKREFAANTTDNKKWKGVLRVWLPKNDGTEQDEWTKSTLKGMVTAFEKSNPGYRWNWDEKTLVGRTVGIIFRNEEWEYNGKSGWSVRPFRATTADNVRNGEITLPNDKPLKNKAQGGYSGTYSGYGEAYDSFATPPANDFAMMEDDSQLPF